MKISKKTTTVEEYTFNDLEILEALKDAGKLPKDAKGRLTIWVPGGGDWSNMELDIDDDNPIRITVETTTHE